MKLSTFGQRFTRPSGILRLMEDLGTALAGRSDMLMLGGGNPSHIPEVQALFRTRMQRILDNPGEFERLIGNYHPPKGEQDFTEALAALLNGQFGWDLKAENIALIPGSQCGFFMLFNLFAGAFADGTHKQILLPMAPEYIGYADLGLTPNFFVAKRPTIAILDPHTFKYHVDFAKLALGDDIGAICVSRPTNPTGNVLTDEEIIHLAGIAQSHDIPLIIDNAYGAPFPNIIFTEVRPIWDRSIVLCMSLSKIGLPAARTGIVIARQEIIEAIAAINAIVNLASGGFGPALALDLVKTGELIRLSREIIMPYYRARMEQAVLWLRQALEGYDYAIHKPEGALFLWLWFKDLPITSQALYLRLKRRGVLVVPGDYFFPGFEEDWRHTHECIRVTYSQDPEIVRTGIGILAEEVKKAYDESA
ncbi:MAG TPA: valine--pyruvate transaminase [Gammaproteobacteria bacterium]|nr:valine--pyruvate transaminase [Gammaproteobacteria bacterium]